LTLLATRWAWAEGFPLPAPQDELIGAVTSVTASKDETLLDIARRYDIGQNQILLSNPAVDRWLPNDGAEVTLPTMYILPRTERVGLVLNVPEMRLYYYPPHSPDLPDIVQTYPVSIGRMDWMTPLGTTRIADKTVDPVWRPTASVMAEHAAEGDILPQVVPAGPDNPLGKYAMRLAIPGYLIHGTNKPFGVGMRVSHGCVRMYPEDIEMLFPLIPVGTPVTIIDQPIKLGWLGDALYLEIHPPLEEEKIEEGLRQRVLDLVNAEWEKRRFVLDGAAFNKALELQNGIPMAVGRSVEKTESATVNP